MTGVTLRATLRDVNEAWPGARRSVAALAVFLTAILMPLAARAASGSFDVRDQAYVSISGIKGDITVRTWNKPYVQVESDDDFVGVKTLVKYGGSDLPFDIPMRALPVPTKSGPVALPPEAFLVTSVRAGEHDGVFIRGTSGTATVTVPASLGVLAIFFVRGGPSHVHIDGVRNATMIVSLRGGAVNLNNAGGDGFIQVLNGRVIATNGNFNRIRVRTVNDNVFFQRCTAKQIEASSYHGNVVFDNGTFMPGQARFDSAFGNVLVGIENRGGAQITAHSGAGHIFSNFSGSVVKLEQQNADAVAVVNGGGPLVNLTSEHGNVYLYEGAIGMKRDSPDWREGTAHVAPPLNLRARPPGAPNAAGAHAPAGGIRFRPARRIVKRGR
jgi:hypothetical protein